MTCVGAALKRPESLVHSVKTCYRITEEIPHEAKLTAGTEENQRQKASVQARGINRQCFVCLRADTCNNTSGKGKSSVEAENRWRWREGKQTYRVADKAEDSGAPEGASARSGAISTLLQKHREGRISVGSAWRDKRRGVG